MYVCMCAYIYIYIYTYIQTYVTHRPSKGRPRERGDLQATRTWSLSDVKWQT